jgi:hypothetical protein
MRRILVEQARRKRRLRHGGGLARTCLTNKDTRVDYHSDGTVAQSVVFYYDGDARASDAPFGASVRRAIAYEKLDAH